MFTITFDITQTEHNVLRTDIVDLTEWSKNALQNKARKLIDRLILENTAYNPSRLTPSEKDVIISKMVLTSVEPEPVEPVIPP